MIQKPIYNYKIGAATPPAQIDPLNLAAVISHDIFLPANAFIQAYDKASTKANPLGGTTNLGTTLLDTQLNVNDIIADENGNSWFEAVDNNGVYHAGQISNVVFIPATPQSVPSTSLNAYSEQASVPLYNYVPAPAGTATVQTNTGGGGANANAGSQGAGPSSAAPGTSPATGNLGVGLFAGKGFGPFTGTEAAGLSLVLLILAGVTIYELQK